VDAGKKLGKSAGRGGTHHHYWDEGGSDAKLDGSLKNWHFKCVGMKTSATSNVVATESPRGGWEIHKQIDPPLCQMPGWAEDSESLCFYSFEAQHKIDGAHPKMEGNAKNKISVQFNSL
jgi:hypothetical protein